VLCPLARVERSDPDHPQWLVDPQMSPQALPDPLAVR
jgi:hypothetical protein